MTGVRGRRLESYLATLPAGLDSYPDCVAKASIIRSHLLVETRVDLKADVPQPLVELVQEPPLASAWIPEVHNVAAFLALADHNFGFDDQAVLAWARDSNRGLTGSRMYAVLLRLASPSMLFKGAGHRWSAMRRGTSVDVNVRGQQAEFTITSPANVFPALFCDAIGTGLEGVLKLCGAKQVSLARDDWTPTRCRFRGSWS